MKPPLARYFSYKGTVVFVFGFLRRVHTCDKIEIYCKRVGRSMNKAKMIYKEIHERMTEKWFLKQDRKSVV